jgi:predicted transcriptional regulator
VQLRQVASLLECEILSGQDRLDLEIDGCFAAELMSDVLASAPNGALLVTGLSSPQMVHTADVADLGAIVLVGGKRPGDEAIATARRHKLPLLLTAHSLFDVCGLLFQQGLRASAPAQ